MYFILLYIFLGLKNQGKKQNKLNVLFNPLIFLVWKSKEKSKKSKKNAQYRV